MDPGIPFGPSSEEAHGPAGQETRRGILPAADNWAPLVRRPGRLQPPAIDFAGDRFLPAVTPLPD
jgi:hypothetical protein